MSEELNVEEENILDERSQLVEKLGFDPAQQDELPKRDKLQLEDEKPIDLEYESGRPIVTEYGETNMFLFKDAEGKELIYFSKSKRLLFAVLKAKLKQGDKFQLTKFGQGMDINYKIERL